MLKAILLSLVLTMTLVMPARACLTEIKALPGKAVEWVKGPHPKLKKVGTVAYILARDLSGPVIFLFTK